MMDAHTDDDTLERPLVAIQRISHELRTPLTVVIGFCELLQDNPPDDDSIKEFAARISVNAWLLASAVERLITELHNAEYTGLLENAQFHGQGETVDERPDFAASAERESSTPSEQQVDEGIATDEVRPSEQFGLPGRTPPNCPGA